MGDVSTQKSTHVWEFELGCIGFSSRKGGIFPAMVRTFTGSAWSHTFLTFFVLWKTGGTVLEASSLVQTIPFDRGYVLNPNESFHLFRVTEASSEAKGAASERVFYELAGDEYGKLELLWFIWRWVNKKFGRDIRHSKNWFTDGVICSELVYWYLFYLGDPYKKLIEDFNPDTIQAQDIYEIVLGNKGLFERVI